MVQIVPSCLPDAGRCGEGGSHDQHVVLNWLSMTRKLHPQRAALVRGALLSVRFPGHMRARTHTPGKQGQDDLRSHVVRMVLSDAADKPRKNKPKKFRIADIDRVCVRACVCVRVLFCRRARTGRRSSAWLTSTASPLGMMWSR